MLRLKSIKQLNSGLLFLNKNKSFTTTNKGSYTITNKTNETSNDNRTTETISEVEKLRKKLLYQSKERGMLENDLLLGSFATLNIQKLTESQLKDYDQLLQQPDPDIFNWILNKTEIPEEFETDVLKLVQYHCKNDPLGYTRK